MSIEWNALRMLGANSGNIEERRKKGKEKEENEKWREMITTVLAKQQNIFTPYRKNHGELHQNRS